MVFLMKAVDICSDLRHTEAAAFISSPGLHWVDNAAQTGWGCRKNVKDMGGRIIEGSGGQRGGSGSSLLSTWEEKGDFGAVDWVLLSSIPAPNWIRDNLWSWVGLAEWTQGVTYPTDLCPCFVIGNHSHQQL